MKAECAEYGLCGRMEPCADAEGYGTPECLFDADGNETED
jgi:hypothetical protein